MAWTEKREFEKAVADFNEAIRIQPQASLAYSRCADIRAFRGEFHKAMADYEQSIRLDRQSSSPLPAGAGSGSSRAIWTRPLPTSIAPSRSTPPRLRRTCAEAMSGRSEVNTTRRSKTTACDPAGPILCRSLRPPRYCLE